MSDSDRAATRAAWGDRASAVQSVEKITAHPLLPEIARRTVEDMLRTSRAAWLAWLDIGSREDIANQMAGIALPDHVFAGDADPIVPPPVQTRKVLARLPHARPSCRMRAIFCRWKRRAR